MYFDQATINDLAWMPGLYPINDENRGRYEAETTKGA